MKMNDPEIERALVKGLSPVCDYCGTNKNRLYLRAGHTVCEIWSECEERGNLTSSYNDRAKDYERYEGPTIRIFPDGTKEVVGENRRQHDP